MRKFIIEKYELDSLPQGIELYEILITQDIGLSGDRLLVEKSEIQRLHDAIHKFLGEKTIGKTRPLHPGEVLLEEFIKPKYGNIRSFYDLERLYNYPTLISIEYLYELCDKQDNIYQSVAEILSDVLGTTPEFWLGLQADYDREVGETGE
jgi:plasmid maintenance system antidote protein VapI